MCKAPKVIQLCRDSRLESTRDGSPAIYWTGEAQQTEALGGRGVRVTVEVLDLAPNTEIMVFGQYGPDRRNWTDFAAPLTYAGDPISDLGSHTFVYAGPPEEFAEFVRFGIQIKHGAETAQAWARMTATATVLFENVLARFPMVPAAGVTLGTPSSPTMVPDSERVDLSNFDTAQFLLHWTGTPTSLIIYTFGSIDGINYAEIARTTTFTAAGAAILVISQMFKYVELRYTMSSGTVTLNAACQGRVP